VAATPPTAPAHHSFIPTATPEEEEQSQQHHQPHQLIISFGLCFHFFTYNTCRIEENKEQKTKERE
jgi:hypothetical protein